MRYSRVRTFTGESGQLWTYDETVLLGPPGGFGRVHPGAGEDGYEAAVKVIEVALRLEPEPLFRREVEIGDKLRSGSTDYLLPALDWGSEGGELLIVLDKAEGSLLEHIAPAPLDVPATIEVLLDICAGLEELHQASVVHRDLKPGNVLRHEGRWKLADFGISRDSELGTQSLTWQGAGSLPYMAPEMWALKRPPRRVTCTRLAAWCINCSRVHRRSPVQTSRTTATSTLQRPLPPCRMGRLPRCHVSCSGCWRKTRLVDRRTRGGYVSAWKP